MSSSTFYYSLYCWAILTRVSTTPAADFCWQDQDNYSTLSPESETLQQISRDTLDCFPRATTGFTLCVLDRYGFRPLPLADAHALRSVLVTFGSRFAHASFRPASPATPLRSLSLHLYQVVKRTYTSKLLEHALARTNHEGRTTRVRLLKTGSDSYFPSFHQILQCAVPQLPSSRVQEMRAPRKKARWDCGGSATLLRACFNRASSPGIIALRCPVYPRLSRRIPEAAYTSPRFSVKWISFGFSCTAVFARFGSQIPLPCARAIDNPRNE